MLYPTTSTLRWVDLDNIWCVWLYFPRVGRKGLASRSHRLWLSIPISVVSFWLKPPEACRLLVKSWDKVWPNILQLLPATGCRSGERCLRERWFLICSRPKHFFRPSPTFLPHRHCQHQNAGFWLAAISEDSILVSIWVLYFTHHTTIIHSVYHASCVKLKESIVM